MRRNHSQVQLANLFFVRDISHIFSSLTHIAKVTIQYLYVAVDDLQRNQLVVVDADPAHEKQGRVASVHDLGVCVAGSQMNASAQNQQVQSPIDEIAPLYSRKLHILVRRASTSCVTSFTIFALVLGAIVMNHFARRTFPMNQHPVCAFQYPSYMFVNAP
ncbi:hypothetical protein D9619_000776 [Psilocybe cf. subviscida]|uniref:Uncharacterized protein n=1 Tax=Psilocybe cf. subviscida TaxID=2480587 RepID=A0A8H5BDC9_9AGAR|nr:hypothetical protein D9619_000776 [Psilocybe cf. subviscida]